VEGMISSSSSSSLPSPVAQLKSIEAEDRLSRKRTKRSSKLIGNNLQPFLT
jgi:hypothetical protein